MKLMTALLAIRCGNCSPLIRASRRSGSHPVRSMWWLAVGCVVAASMVFSPSLAVLIASLAIATGAARGRQLAHPSLTKQAAQILFAVHLRLGCMEGRTCGLCLSVHDWDPGPFGA